MQFLVPFIVNFAHALTLTLSLTLTSTLTPTPTPTLALALTLTFHPHQVNFALFIISVDDKYNPNGYNAPTWSTKQP